MAHTYQEAEDVSGYRGNHRDVSGRQPRGILFRQAWSIQVEEHDPRRDHRTTNDVASHGDLLFSRGAVQCRVHDRVDILLAAPTHRRTGVLLKLLIIVTKTASGERIECAAARRDR